MLYGWNTNLQIPFPCSLTCTKWLSLLCFLYKKTVWIICHVMQLNCSQACQKVSSKEPTDLVLEAELPLQLSAAYILHQCHKWYAGETKPHRKCSNQCCIYCCVPYSHMSHQAKTHEPSRHRHREELHFVDEYGQPITMQTEGRRGRGHRRRRSHCAIECSVPTERHWEALRAMGLMEGEEGQGDSYSAG